jgi:hypothetical protein
LHFNFSLSNEVNAPVFAETKQRVEEKKKKKAAPELLHSGTAERGILKNGTAYLAARALMMSCA